MRPVLTADIRTSAGAFTVNAPRRYWLGILLVALAAVAFSQITMFSKLAYLAGSTPVTLVWLRFVAFVGVIGLVLLGRRQSFRLPARNLRGSAVLAFGMFLMSVGYLSSVAYIDVSLAVILLYSFPLMVGLLSALAGRERITLVKALCLILAFAGLVWAVGPGFERLDWRGVGLALGAAFGLTITITWGGAYLEGVEPLVVNVWANLWMLAVMSAYVLGFGDLVLPQSATGWIGLCGATGCYIFAIVVLFVAMRWVTPAQTAVTLNIEPIFSIAAAVLVLHETVTWGQACGIAIMLIAIVFSAVWGAVSKS
jgi:drug/metabolite transporter (DMT)-like permease